MIWLDDLSWLGIQLLGRRIKPCRQRFVVRENNRLSIVQLVEFGVCVGDNCERPQWFTSSYTRYQHYGRWAKNKKYGGQNLLESRNHITLGGALDSRSYVL